MQRGERARVQESSHNREVHGGVIVPRKRFRTVDGQQEHDEHDRERHRDVESRRLPRALHVVDGDQLTRGVRAFARAMPLLTSKAIAPIATRSPAIRGPNTSRRPRTGRYPAPPGRKSRSSAQSRRKRNERRTADDGEQVPRTYSTATHTTTAKASMSHIEFPKNWFPTPTI